MKFVIWILFPILVLGVAAFLYVSNWFSNGLSSTEVARYYGTPKGPRDAPLSVYHLGHSLVGHDMPVMLEQLAGAGHTHASQIGSYATLMSHWEPDVPVPSFDVANTHAAHRDPREALASGDFDAFVLTERIDLKKTIREANTPDYVVKFADLAWQANPKAEVYVYETWYFLSSRWGWRRLVEWDRPRYWEAGITDPAVRQTDRPIYIIPGGTALAAFTKQVEQLGGVGGITGAQDLFRDHIHFNDIGAYLVALTHYAVLYRKSPVGLPHQLVKADGTDMASLDPEAAALMQKVVWDVVTSYHRTGVGDG